MLRSRWTDFGTSPIRACPCLQQMRDSQGIQFSAQVLIFLVCNVQGIDARLSEISTPQASADLAFFRLQFRTGRPQSSQAVSKSCRSCVLCERRCNWASWMEGTFRKRFPFWFWRTGWHESELATDGNARVGTVYVISLSFVPSGANQSTLAL